MREADFPMVKMVKAVFTGLPVQLQETLIRPHLFFCLAVEIIEEKKGRKLGLLHAAGICDLTT